jgi:hypothetical protein
MTTSAPTSAGATSFTQGAAETAPSHAPWIAELAVEMRQRRGAFLALPRQASLPELSLAGTSHVSPWRPLDKTASDRLGDTTDEEAIDRLFGQSDLSFDFLESPQSGEWEVKPA